MDQARSRWFVVGSMVAAGVASILLGIIALSRFLSDASGHDVVSSAGGSTLIIVLLGTLCLFALERTDSTGRRMSCAISTQVRVGPRAGRDLRAGGSRPIVSNGGPT
jgi:hypothetical protein